MMKKNILFVFLMLASVAMADKKQVAIISVNDMHANVQKMPVLADIVDSIRAIYPNLLVLSAGDNRTGSPINDQYRIPAYPMVAMMNAIGFDASALGNHEFDSGVDGLGRLINLAHFRHLCANIEDPQEHGLNVLPYQFFDMDGIRVGILSVVQLSDRGTPSVHPNKIVGLEFKNEKETIAKYKWMRDECDLNILLDHSGYPAEKEFCEEFPYYDLIIGGHTHTKVDGERINGVLLSQTEWQLKYVCLTVVTFDDKKIVSKEAKLIDVNKHQGRSEVLYDEFGIALIAVGSMVKTAARVRDLLRETGYSCSLINARFVKPLDEEMLLAAAKDHKLIVTLEENVRTGGFGDHVLEFLSDVGAQTRVINIALPDEYIEHGNVDVLYKETLLDEDSILKKIIAEYAGMEE